MQSSNISLPRVSHWESRISSEKNTGSGSDTVDAPDTSLGCVFSALVNVRAVKIPATVQCGHVVVSDNAAFITW